MPNPAAPPPLTPSKPPRPEEMKQFRGRKASLWQSAVDQVVSKRGGSEPITSQGSATGKMRLKRPDQTGAEVQSANHIAAAISIPEPAPPTASPAVTAAVPPVAGIPALPQVGAAAPLVPAAAIPDNAVAVCASMAF